MKRTCENCNRPLFDTDTICWHCGQQQSLPVQPESTSEQPISDNTLEDDPEPETEPVASALILFYGGLTAVIFLALLLTMRSLGQSPIVSLKADSAQGEWVSISAPDNSFTIEIPAKWDWGFLENMGSSPSGMDVLESDAQILTAVTPLGELVPDIEYLLKAENDSSLLVVARSERLNRLTPHQAVTSLQGEQFDNMTVTEARLIQGVKGEEKAFFSLLHLDTPLHCDQYLVPAPPETYVVAACSLAESYNRQRDTRQTILDSFTPHPR